MNVIVDTSFGNCSVFAGTVENAMNILDCHLDNLEAKVIELSKFDKKIISKELIIKVLNKILSLKEGEMASKTIQVTKENKQELVMYCFNKKIKIDNERVSDYNFFKDFNVMDLSFFATNENYPKDAEIVDEYLIEQSHKYKTIMNNRWKDGVKEISKIRFILDFAKEIGHRDEHYEVTELKELVT